MNLNPNNPDTKWIGEIPSDWSLEKVRYFFTERSEKVDDTSYPPLSVSKGGVVDQIETVSKSDDNENRKMVLKDDFVINSRSDRKGSSGISPRDGSVSLINIVLEPKNINPQYAEYLFKSYYFKEEFFRNGKGIHFDLWSTRYEMMKNILIPFPDLEEQKKIVHYLDEKITPIDRMLELLKAKITSLHDLRDSIINKIFTKGIDLETEFKFSGDNWIGDIPSHWEVKKLKYLVLENQENLSKSTPSNLELDYIEISNVNSIGQITKPTPYYFYDCPSRCRRICRKGDVIISTVRTYLKSIGLIKEERENLICSTGFSVLTPREGYLSKYIFYMLRTNWFISRIISKSEGVSYPSIKSHKLLNTKVVVTDVLEQQKIVDYLDKETSYIDELIIKEEKRLKLFKEYRQSLISEVVMGKKRVIG